MKAMFYLIAIYPIVADKVQYVMILGGSGGDKLVLTHWAEYAKRLTTFKDALMLEERTRREMPAKNTAIVKYEMDVDVMSFAKPKDAVPTKYKNLIDFNEEERKLTVEDKRDVEIYLRTLKPSEL